MSRIRIVLLGCDCRSVWCVLDCVQHKIQNLNLWTFTGFPISDRICDRHDEHITGDAS